MKWEIIIPRYEVIANLVLNPTVVKTIDWAGQASHQTLAQRRPNSSLHQVAWAQALGLAKPNMIFEISVFALRGLANTLPVASRCVTYFSKEWVNVEVL